MNAKLLFGSAALAAVLALPAMAGERGETRDLNRDQLSGGYAYNDASYRDGDDDGYYSDEDRDRDDYYRDRYGNEVVRGQGFTGGPGADNGGPSNVATDGTTLGYGSTAHTYPPSTSGRTYSDAYRDYDDDRSSDEDYDDDYDDE